MKASTAASPIVSNHFMRQFAILIFTLFHTAFSFGQITNDDLNFFNYSYDKPIMKKNKVETITIEMSFSKDKNSVKHVYYFDKDGLLTKLSIMNSKGNLEREIYFLANSQNDLILRIQKDYEYKSVDTVKYFKSYSNNKLISDSSSEIPISFNFEYSSNGNLIKSITKSNFGLGNKTKRVTDYKFDSLNRIINSVETFFQNDNDKIGTAFSDRNFFYNIDGKIEQEVEKLNNKYSWMSNKGSIKYVYDLNGNLIQILSTNGASYFYTYNEKGLITTKKMDMKLESDDIIQKETKIETLDNYIYTFRQ